MCGIFGIISKVGPVCEARTRELTDLVAHRGPDGSGVYTDGNVGLGHRRLAIVDLSEAGAQPMRATKHPLWITYNGEIYNYLELRAELEALGHVFHTGTDTEVLLSSYIEWGENCLERFNGMWAFAIYDERTKKLFCARDRFGVKPFYFVETPTAFAFGSEIKQLLPFLAKREADEGLIADFLICGLSDHADRSFFKNIAKLGAGRCMVVDAATGVAKVRRYYTLAPDRSVGNVGAGDAPGKTLDLLDDAVRLRLRSDVVVGTCLSGGLDSSSIAKLAATLHAKVSDKLFCAVTAVSEQQSNNEEKYAAIVVERSNLNWIRVTPSYEDFSSNLQKLIDIQEEPFGGPSIMMQHFVMKAAHAQGIKVLLDGQGGDETLLGYERYYASWLFDHLRRDGVVEFMRAFRAATRVNSNVSMLRLAIYFAAGSFSWLRALAYRWRYGFLKNKTLPDALVRFATSTRDSANMQMLEINQTNLPMLLRFEDKNSMHFGIETRLPFLDFRFVEFALGIPLRIKLRDGWTKWPLRAAMRNMLPESILWRKDKIGFAAPDQLWLDRHEKVLREKIFASDFLARYVDFPTLNRTFSKVDRGMRWRLYCVAIWAERFEVRSA